jgi:hypothetical protein
MGKSIFVHNIARHPLDSLNEMSSAFIVHEPCKGSVTIACPETDAKNSSFQEVLVLCRWWCHVLFRNKLRAAEANFRTRQQLGSHWHWWHDWGRGWCHRAGVVLRLHGLGFVCVVISFFGSISSLRFLGSCWSLCRLTLTTALRSLTTLRGILLECALVQVVAIISAAVAAGPAAIISRTLALATSIVPPSIALRLSLPLFLCLGAQFIEQWCGGRWRCWHYCRALAVLGGALHECNVIGLAADRVQQRVARCGAGEFYALIGSPFELRFVFDALAVHECVAVVHLVELVQRIERDKVEIGPRGYFACYTARYKYGKYAAIDIAYSEHYATKIAGIMMEK